MVDKLRRIIRIPTTKDVIINTAGNYLSIFFTALYALLLVRILSPSEYGVLSVLFAIAYLLAMILDFGVTASIYSYLPPLLENRQEAYSFIKANFVFQTILSCAVLLISFVFIDHLDVYIFKLNVPTSYYFWTFLSIPLFIWQNFVLNVFFAAKKFLYANIVNNVAYFLKAVLLFVLILLDKVSVEYVIIIFGIIGQLVFFVVLLKDRKHLLLHVLRMPFDRRHIRLQYTLTFFIATQLFNLASRIDLFMLSYFLAKSEVGYYGLSQKIILTVISMINAITQVLSPLFAKAETRSETISLLKKGFLYMLIPSAVFLAAILAPTNVYTLFFTDKFAKTATITRMLSAAFILYAFAAVPTLFFLYTVKKPIHLLYMNLLFLVVVAVGCFILIQEYGVFGPPATFVAAFLLVGLYITIALKKEIRTLR